MRLHGGEGARLPRGVVRGVPARNHGFGAGARGHHLMSAEKIRALNDAFRTTMIGGRVMMTTGVDALPSDVKAMVIRRVATFSDFSPDNDPHGEHDFGNFTLAGRKFFWKIDAYDADMRFGSEDPADPAKTTRILTIMLAEEY